MAETVALLVLFGSIASFGLALRHAYPSTENVVFLLSAAVYTIILETLFIVFLEAFAYNPARMLLHLGEVPISIGLIWAAVIYAGSETGWEFGMEKYRIPVFTAVFAVMIDFGLEAVAVETSLWAWREAGVWFGAPTGIFIAWMVIPGVFTAAWIFLSLRGTGLGMKSVAATAISVIGASALLYLQTLILRTQIAQSIGAVVLALAGMIYFGRNFEWENKVDAELIAIPFVIYGLFGLVFLHARPETSAAVPLLAAVALGIVLYAHSSREVLASLRKSRNPS